MPLYAPLDVHYYDDNKVILAGESAEILFVRGLAFCKRQRTNGFVSRSQLARLGLKKVTQRARKLVEVGLWSEVDGGYEVVSWSKYNRTKEEIEALSRVRSDSGKQGGRPPKSNLLSVGESKAETQGKGREGKSNQTVGSKEPTRSGDGTEPTIQPLIFAALCEVSKTNTRELPAAARSSIGKIAKELVEVGASPDEVRARAQRYRDRFGPDISLTPGSLSKHWATLTADEPSNDGPPLRYVNER